MAKGRQAQRSAAHKRRKSAPRPTRREAPTASESTSAATSATPARPAALAKAVVPSIPTSRSAAKAPDFSVEYRYVLSDLKRLGILAVGSFVALVILALIIR